MCAIYMDLAVSEEGQGIKVNDYFGFFFTIIHIIQPLTIIHYNPHPMFFFFQTNIFTCIILQSKIEKYILIRSKD
jgi:hypothetical protein